jgi:hypothetical protein
MIASATNLGSIYLFNGKDDSEEHVNGGEIITIR